MPRKQRFKPSRKPKPITPNEDAVNVRTTSSAQPHNDNATARDAPPCIRDDDSMIEPPSDQPSR
ncbi:MAG TPA: hypothetical protein VFK02_08505 [Kofleriaceae bacterium]|nr:hypothetical protein [Kofleriaceae bacterium]